MSETKATYITEAKNEGAFTCSCGHVISYVWRDEAGLYIPWYECRIYGKAVIKCPHCHEWRTWYGAHSHHPAFIDQARERRKRQDAELAQITNCAEHINNV